MIDLVCYIFTELMSAVCRVDFVVAVTQVLVN